MEIVKYTEEWKEKWDEFVMKSNNGTMFHLQKFFDYHTPGKFTFDHLMFIEKGNIVALLPGSVVDDMVYESPIGASYGSLVLGDYTFSKTLDIVDTLINYGKSEGYKKLMLTSAPMIYEEKMNQNLEFALRWRNFYYELHYISSAVKLFPDEDILQRFAPTIRRNIRKSFKLGVRVEINERYDQFYPILLDNKQKHNAKPTHSYDDLMKLKELLPDNLKLFMVYLDDKPIGGSLMFVGNNRVAICFYNMLYYDYQDYKPIQRVMYEVVKYYTEQGFWYVDIGVSQDTKADNPMTPSIGLIDFKEKFDAKTIMRNTLSLEL